jgi:vacuolar-type H+-ATPase subunit E/Vma4
VTAGPVSRGGPRFDGLDLRGLRPVSDAMAQEAARRVERILADADAEVKVILDAAKQQGEGLLASARSDGAAAARRLAAASVGDARRDARQEVLGAQRAVYEEVRARARARLDALATSPDAAALAKRLGEHARRRLGSDAVVESSEREVGLVAHSGGRRLDLSASALLELEMAFASTQIAELWS